MHHWRAPKTRAPRGPRPAAKGAAHEDFLDITRLATRIFRSGPTGIDRVEYAYAKHLLDASRHGLRIHRAGFLRRHSAVARARPVVAGRARLAARRDGGDGRRLYGAARLARRADRHQRRASGPHPHREALADLLRDADFFPLRDIVRAETRAWRGGCRETATSRRCSSIARTPSCDKPQLVQWLETPGLRSAFFMHDAIPIEFPGVLLARLVRPACRAAHHGLRPRRRW